MSLVGRLFRVHERKGREEMSVKDVGSMTEEELRQGLRKIREERAGKGRARRATARTKRIDGQVKERRQRKNMEAEERAEWV